MESYRFDPKKARITGQVQILLAEDGKVEALILDKLFSKAGYAFSWIDDGALAYEAIKAGFTPDVFITDIMMPGMSGFELLTRLQSENILPPTIVLTSVQNEEEVLRGLKSGALDYIKKPFSPAVLLARVELILQRNSSQEKNGQAKNG